MHQPPAQVMLVLPMANLGVPRHGSPSAAILGLLPVLCATESFHPCSGGTHVPPRALGMWLRGSACSLLQPTRALQRMP